MICRKVSELPANLKWSREHGLKVVFTNGCFDLLHVGHVRSLQFAQEQGGVAHCLIVGLNSDKSVRKLKGPSRPILPEMERAEILSALRYVDHVILFDEETPERLIKALRPDVLVKGADYKGRFIAGRKWAGRVALAPLVKGISTTDILRRAQS